MISYNEAIKIIGRRVAPTGIIDVPLPEACGMVLARDIRSPEPIPCFDTSLMDGFAVRSRDGKLAAPDNPVSIRIIGEAAAGRPWSGRLRAGEGVRIMTGAPIPAGANAVVRQEECLMSGGSVHLRRPPLAGENIRRRSSELRCGTKMLRRGNRLDPFAVNILGTVGITSVKVHRRPTVAVMTTGSELVDIRSDPPPGGIRNSNTMTTALLIRQAGGVPKPLGIARDTRKAIMNKVRRASGADMLIITGGSAGGKYDLVREALSEMGGEIIFHGVEMHPGRTSSFGIIGVLPFLSLPGNPYASYVGFLVLAREALFRMSGFRGESFITATARLGENLSPGKGRVRFILAALQHDGNGLIAIPRPHITRLASGNSRIGLIEVNGLEPSPGAGDEVRVRIMM